TAQLFSTATMTSEKLLKPQRTNWGAPENSISRSSPRFCQQLRFILPRLITRNTTSRTRNSLKHSREDQVGFPSKGKLGMIENRSADSNSTLESKTLSLIRPPPNASVNDSRGILAREMDR